MWLGRWLSRWPSLVLTSWKSCLHWIGMLWLSTLAFFVVLWLVGIMDSLHGGYRILILDEFIDHCACQKAVHSCTLWGHCAVDIDKLILVVETWADIGQLLSQCSFISKFKVCMRKGWLVIKCTSTPWGYFCPRPASGMIAVCWRILQFPDCLDFSFKVQCKFKCIC